jgi:hypothetical protein
VCVCVCVCVKRLLSVSFRLTTTYSITLYGNVVFDLYLLFQKHNQDVKQRLLVSVSDKMPYDSVMYWVSPCGLKSHGLLNTRGVLVMNLLNGYTVFWCYLLHAFWLNYVFGSWQQMCLWCTQIQLCVAVTCFGIIYSILGELLAILAMVCKIHMVCISCKANVV